MTLEAVTVFEVPSSVIDASDEALRKAGGSGHELFVLWTGSLSDHRFTIQHVYVPQQRSYRGEEGLHVRVEADDLNLLNRWLFENRQALAVQVHSHPRDAYHSATDDTYPIVTALGGLSIVVPDFGRAGIKSARLAVYRLTKGGWELRDRSLIKVLS